MVARNHFLKCFIVHEEIRGLFEAEKLSNRGKKADELIKGYKVSIVV